MLRSPSKLALCVGEFLLPSGRALGQQSLAAEGTEGEEGEGDHGMQVDGEVDADADGARADHQGGGGDFEGHTAVGATGNAQQASGGVSGWRRGGSGGVDSSTGGGGGGHSLAAAGAANHTGYSASSPVPRAGPSHRCVLCSLALKFPVVLYFCIPPSDKTRSDEILTVFLAAVPVPGRVGARVCRALT